MGPLITINLDGTAREVHSDLWRIWLLPGEPERGVVIRVPIDPEATIRWEELDHLSGLTEIQYGGRDSRLPHYLAGRPGISRLAWSQHHQRRLDFSATSLRELSFDLPEGPLEVVLPRSGSLTRLALPAPADPGQVRVDAPEQGRGIVLMAGCQAAPEGPAAIRGLERIRALSLFNVQKVRLEPLQAYGELEELSITGPPGSIVDIERLDRFPKLRRLSLRDCYDFHAPAFPPAGALPELETVEIDGIRKADADVLAKRLAGLRALSLRGKRTDGWLRANLHNPFREWPEEHDPVLGRAAMTAYRKATTELERAASAADPDMAGAALRRFVEAFNRLGERSPFDTIQREQVSDAYDELAAQVEALVPLSTAQEWYEEWEDL